MDARETGAPDPGLKILTLGLSVGAFGLVMDRLSSAAPFSRYPAARLAQVVRSQLSSGRNLAALDAGERLVGYIGWIATLQASADLWLEDRGPLVVARDGAFDAVALTVAVSSRREVTSRLLRAAREANPGVKVYFKRERPLRPTAKWSLSRVDPADNAG